jgi:hypothetical protein
VWRTGKNEKIQSHVFENSGRRVDRSQSQIEVHQSMVSFTYPKGALVEHATYGAGTVMGGEGSGDDEKVMIKFHHGS